MIDCVVLEDQIVHACDYLITHLVEVDDAGREASGEGEDGLGVLLALAQPLVLDRRGVHRQKRRTALHNTTERATTRGELSGIDDDGQVIKGFKSSCE